jgi:RimJ/RimL family protein N-acetyltransferase
MRFGVAKKRDIAGILDVMKTTGYTNAFFHNIDDEKIKHKLIHQFHERKFLICYYKESFFSEKNIIGYFMYSSVDNYLDNEILDINKKFAYHLGVGTHKDYVGNKIATRLTQLALRYVQRDGYKGIYADVDSTNKGSLKVLERCGFKEIIMSESKKRKGKNIILEYKFS